MDGKASTYNAGDWVHSLGREDHLEKEMVKRAQSLGTEDFGANPSLIAYYVLAQTV